MAKRKETQSPDEQALRAEAMDTEEKAQGGVKSDNDAPAPETGGEKTGSEAKESLEQELLKKLAAGEDKYLRLLAEYDNYRKRSAREKGLLYSEATADTVAKLLSVYDNLELAVRAPTKDEAYAKGVELTFTGLKECFEKMGITEQGSVGEAFDPEKHNAVMHVEDEEADSNVIVEVFQKGFALKDRVIRHAMVKVAN